MGVEGLPGLFVSDGDSAIMVARGFQKAGKVRKTLDALFPPLKRA